MGASRINSRKPLVDPELEHANRVRQLIAQADAGKVPVRVVKLPFTPEPIAVTVVMPNQLQVAGAFSQARETGSEAQAQVHYAQWLLPDVTYLTWDDTENTGVRLIRDEQDADLWSRILGTPQLVDPLFAALLELLKEARQLSQKSDDPNANDPGSKAGESGSELPVAGTIEDPGIPISAETSSIPSGDDSWSEASVKPASSASSAGS